MGEVNLSQTPQPVSINQVQPTFLHDVWPFVRIGVETVKRKVKPDFIPEDVYAAVRFNNAQLYMVTRGPRALGFFVTYTQRRPFSNKLEYLLWIGYAIPLRERLPDDNLPEAVAMSLAFMREQARTLGAVGPVMLSTRKGFERYGFTSGFTTWSMS
jgi:hypothetical protein